MCARASVSIARELGKLTAAHAAAARFAGPKPRVVRSDARETGRTKHGCVVTHQSTVVGGVERRILRQTATHGARLGLVQPRQQAI